MEFSIQATITEESLVEELYYEYEDNVIDFIKKVDIRFADTDFTIRLIQELVDSLKREGVPVEFMVKYNGQIGDY